MSTDAPPRADSAAADEASIVAAVRAAVGDAPVVLLGSRATGTAEPGSDWDVYVVVRLGRVGAARAALAGAAERLSSELGAPITLNPLPRARLRRPGATLLVPKLGWEGRVLAPEGFALPRRAAVAASPRAAASYAQSALRALVGAVDRPAPERAHAVRKALLAGAQLRLLEMGRWESALEPALAVLGDRGWARWAATAEDASTWVAVRDALLPVAASGPDRTRPIALAANVQWMVLGAGRVSGVLRRPCTGDRLARALVALAGAVRPSGGPTDPALVAPAAAALPPEIRPDHADLVSVRAAIERAWPAANPLVGI